MAIDFNRFVGPEGEFNYDEASGRWKCDGAAPHKPGTEIVVR